VGLDARRGMRRQMKQVSSSLVRDWKSENTGYADSNKGWGSDEEEEMGEMSEQELLEDAIVRSSMFNGRIASAPAYEQVWFVEMLYAMLNVYGCRNAPGCVYA